MLLQKPFAAMQGVTRIKYCTDGVLLREMMEDPLLSTYRCAFCTDRISCACILYKRMCPATAQDRCKHELSGHLSPCQLPNWHVDLSVSSP